MCVLHFVFHIFLLLQFALFWIILLCCVFCVRRCLLKNRIDMLQDLLDGQGHFQPTDFNTLNSKCNRSGKWTCCSEPVNFTEPCTNLAWCSTQVDHTLNWSTSTAPHKFLPSCEYLFLNNIDKSSWQPIRVLEYRSYPMHPMHPYEPYTSYAPYSDWFSSPPQPITMLECRSLINIKPWSHPVFAPPVYIN